MKLVTMKELVKHGGQQFFAGESRMVSDEDAELFCKHGWATADGLATGERVPGAASLEVKAGAHVSKTKVG